MKIKLLLKILLAFSISFYFVSKYTGQFLIEYQIKIIENNNSLKGELFYSKNGSFTAKYRKSIHYKPLKNKLQTIKIDLGSNPDITSIRLDPLTSSGIVEIQNMTMQYKGQTHTIDFSKINDKNYQHNIKIVEKSRNHILLQCLGKDPHIELTHTINFSNINLQDIIIIFFLTLIMYFSFSFILKLMRRPTFNHIVLASIIIIYAYYALLFSSPGLASSLLIIFATISMIIAVANNNANSIAYIKGMGIFLLAYFIMSYLSIYITTEHANLDYLNAKMPYIILASLIPIGFYNIRNFNLKFFKLMLTVTLISVATTIILLDQHIISIKNIHFLNHIMFRNDWTQKNYMFMYVLLIFGTLSFYDVKKRFDLLIIFIIIVLSFFIVFNGYSNSARLSYIAGLVFYFILTVFSITKKHLLMFIWILTLYIILSPIIFSLLDVFSYIPALHGRTYLYNTSFAFIKEHWLLGYGYGSTLTIHLRDFVSAVDLPKQYANTFYGGHPHNLSLLFWLEFGMFGALFLAYFIHKLLKYFIENTYTTINHAALFGMIIAFDIITSFSWSIWYPQVLLTFSFFVMLLILSMNIQVPKEDHTKQND